MTPNFTFTGPSSLLKLLITQDGFFSNRLLASFVSPTPPAPLLLFPLGPVDVGTAQQREDPGESGVVVHPGPHQCV